MTESPIRRALPLEPFPSPRALRDLKRSLQERRLNLSSSFYTSVFGHLSTTSSPSNAPPPAADAPPVLPRRHPILDSVPLGILRPADIRSSAPPTAPSPFSPPYSSPPSPHPTPPARTNPSGLASPPPTAASPFASSPPPPAAALSTPSRTPSSPTSRASSSLPARP